MRLRTGEVPTLGSESLAGAVGSEEEVSEGEAMSKGAEEEPEEERGFWREEAGISPEMFGEEVGVAVAVREVKSGDKIA